MSIKAKKRLFLSITGFLSLGLIIGTVLLFCSIWVHSSFNPILAAVISGLPASILAYFLGNFLIKKFKVKRWQFLCCLFLPSAAVFILIDALALLNSGNYHNSDNVFDAFMFTFAILLIIGGIFVEYMIIMGLHGGFLDLIHKQI